MVIDDELNVLPISTSGRNIKALPQKDSKELTPKTTELKDLKRIFRELTYRIFEVGLSNYKPAQTILTFIDVISEKDFKYHCCFLTAGRGRGKSAAGVPISACLSRLLYIFVIPISRKLKKPYLNLFSKGFDALEIPRAHWLWYNQTYLQSDFNKSIVKSWYQRELV